MSATAAPPGVNREVKVQGKGVHWYRTDLETINEPARVLFEKYSGLPPDRVIPPVLKMVGAQYNPLLPKRIELASGKPSQQG
jgi:hypothetical protein